MLKNLLENNITNPYNMTATKVFTSYGFCKYLTHDDTIRWLVCADNINDKKKWPYCSS